MKVNPESYLGANRDNPDELVQAVLGDLSVVGALREKSDTEIHASDTIYTILGQLDVQLGTAVAFWQENEPVPGVISKFARKNATLARSGLAMSAMNTYFALRDDPIEDVVSSISRIGLLEAPSVLQPGWKPTVLEQWTRVGSRITHFPYVSSFIGSKGGFPYNGPDSKTKYDALYTTACVSEFLNKVYAHNLERNDLLPAERARLEAHRAMLLEYEALLWINEDMLVSPNEHLWVFPSTPSMDFGSSTGSASKIDILCFVTEAGKIKSEIGVDIKQKHKEQRPRSDVLIFSALDMGLERVVGDERVIEYDGASKLFLAGHEEMFRGHLTASPHYRTALALAAIGMPIRREKVEGPLCLE